MVGDEQKLYTSAALSMEMALKPVSFMYNIFLSDIKME
jgi:hypothetical protein